MNGCHSRDFDAQIAHVSVTMIAFNMFSTAKRLNSYETMGDLDYYLLMKKRCDLKASDMFVPASAKSYSR